MALESIVVVGASLAGLSAAEAVRRGGFDGRLTIIGDEPHRPYDRPPLSKQLLAGEWELERTALRSDERLTGLDAEWLLGRCATALDLDRRTVALDDGGAVGFDGLVIATGAGPRPLPGSEGIDGVHVLRTLDDSLALRADLEAGPDRVVVVGAGFIGGEVAATCRGRGLDVTMVEPLAAPLVRATGPAIGGAAAELHRAHGVDLRLGVGVEGVDTGADGRVARVRLADGSSVDASVVVVGIGVVPNTGWLEGSGLTLGDGIVCDESCLAAPGVVAAGDVARWPNRLFGEVMRVEHWDNAVQQGGAAGKRLLIGDGEAEPFAPVPYFWSDQYDRKIQSVGRIGTDLTVEVVAGALETMEFVALYGREGTVVGALGMGLSAHVMRARKLIAASAPWDEAITTLRT